ncbi:MAG TPA: ABC transporter substrate-binding protein [Gammaproteobacteria bacterium]|nr:ABC transporter substrate-binding protein [Gammaproteobacteria bacterium]
MRVFATILVLIAGGLAVGGSGATFAQAQPGPSEVVETAARSMLKDLEADRATYRKDPSKVGVLVEKYLLPHFDIQYSARLVLGKHWASATPEQRERFANAFYRTLVDNYGSALAEFTSDRLKVFPTKVEPNAERASVRTEVIRDNGDKVPVSYSLRKTDDGWKAWDVVIEGISYVKSFREDFGAAIDQQGLDAVIDKIEKGNVPVAPKGEKR